MQGTTADGGWAGDLFVSLNRGGTGGGTSILLNQVGVSGSAAAGFSYDGWNVTFRDNAANGDIHFGEPAGSATLLTGEWQPDGRQSPTATVRPALLGGFNGLSPNTDWNLTLADLNTTGTMSLASWSLTFTGTAVPEPEIWAGLTATSLVAFALLRRHRNRR